MTKELSILGSVVQQAVMLQYYAVGTKDSSKSDVLMIMLWI